MTMTVRFLQIQTHITFSECWLLASSPIAAGRLCFSITHTSADCHRRSAAAAIQPSKTNTESSVTSRTRFIYSDIRIAERHNSAPLGVFLSFFLFLLSHRFFTQNYYIKIHTQNKEKKCVRIICECAWVTLAFPLEKSSLVVGVTASPICSGRYVKIWYKFKLT